jgi:hypothetical protein
MPLVHVPPTPQLMPQAPQFFVSFEGSAQVSLQTMSVALGHAHAPLVHVPPAGQTVPQAPQFAASVLRSTQTSVQMVSVVLAQPGVPPPPLLLAPLFVVDVPGSLQPIHVTTVARTPTRALICNQR